MRPAARIIHLAIAALLVAGLVGQVFLAGLAVFDDPASFATHRNVGYVLGFVPIVLLVVGFVGGVGRRLAGLAITAWLLILVQSVFVAVRGDAPAVAALHPVNGFLIMLVALVIVRESWGLRTTSPTSVLATGPAMETNEAT
jgi:hypothetical protein